MVQRKPSLWVTGHYRPRFLAGDSVSARYTEFGALPGPVLGLATAQEGQLLATAPGSEGKDPQDPHPLLCWPQSDLGIPPSLSRIHTQPEHQGSFQMSLPRARLVPELSFCHVGTYLASKSSFSGQGNPFPCCHGDGAV